MTKELEGIINKYLEYEDKMYESIIRKNKVNELIKEIYDYYLNILEENSKLKGLVYSYEKIIANSNFKIILEPKDGGDDKE